MNDKNHACEGKKNSASGCCASKGTHTGCNGKNSMHSSCCEKTSSHASCCGKSGASAENTAPLSGTAFLELEVRYSIHAEGGKEFFRFENLTGINAYQHLSLIKTELEDCVYPQLEELVCDLNEFLQKEQKTSRRYSPELEVCFILTEPEV